MTGGWTAVVPIKPAGRRKSRLADGLADDDITALTDRMLHRALAVLAAVDAVEIVAMLTCDPPADASLRWFPDRGAGLNEGLREVAVAIPERLLVLFPDLPGVCGDDVATLLDAAAMRGCAIAPDRAGTGTNALALCGATGMPFAFGPDSFARHLMARPDAAVVRRIGLALDIDGRDDIAAAQARGLLPTACLEFAHPGQATAQGEHRCGST